MSLAEILDDDNKARLVRAVQHLTRGAPVVVRWEYKPLRLLMLLADGLPEDRVGWYYLGTEMSKVMDKEQFAAMMSFLGKDFMSEHEIQELVLLVKGNKGHKKMQAEQAKVPDGIRLSVSARALLSAICTVTKAVDVWVPTRLQDLADIAGISRRSAVTAMKDLQQHELVEWAPGNGKLSRSEVRRRV